jgi:hypothetical protein
MEVSMDFTWRNRVFHRRLVTGGRICPRLTSIHASWLTKERKSDRLVLSAVIVTYANNKKYFPSGIATFLFFAAILLMKS